jgi:hypothetical protein
MCYCDSEMPAFIDQSFPRAAKTHWCCECGTAIRAGERYQRTKGMWDHQFSTYDRCRACVDTVRYMTWRSKKMEGCYCEVFGQLMEHVQEEWRESRTKLMGIAYVAMQRRWYNDRAERLAAYDARMAARRAKKIEAEHDARA